MMPTKYVLIADETGAADSTTQTAILDVQDFDALSVRVDAIGGVFPAVSNSWFISFDGAVASAQRTNTLSAGQTFAIGGWFPGCDSNASLNGASFYNSPVPPFVRYSVNALGPGIQARIRIWGRRQARGAVVRNVAQDGVNPVALDS